jgi:signal transduction histidine kinase
MTTLDEIRARAALEWPDGFDPTDDASVELAVALSYMRERAERAERERDAYSKALDEIDHEVRDNCLSLEPDGDYRQDLAEAHRICERIAGIIEDATPGPTPSERESTP